MIEVPKRPSRGPSEDDEDEDEDSQERASGNRKISRFQKGKDLGVTVVSEHVN